MKLNKVDISKDIDGVFKYKSIIENLLIEQKKIESKLNIDEFIEYLDFSKYIYIEGTKNVIPFCLYIIDEDEQVLFHMCEDDEKLNNLVESLTAIKFNFSNLMKLTNEDLIKMDLNVQKLFIIEEQYFGFK